MQEFANAFASLWPEMKHIGSRWQDINPTIRESIHFFGPNSKKRTQRPRASVGEGKIVFVHHTGRGCAEKRATLFHKGRKFFG